MNQAQITVVGPGSVQLARAFADGRSLDGPHGILVLCGDDPGHVKTRQALEGGEHVLRIGAPALNPPVEDRSLLALADERGLVLAAGRTTQFRLADVVEHARIGDVELVELDMGSPTVQVEELIADLAAQLPPIVRGAATYRVKATMPPEGADGAPHCTVEATFEPPGSPPSGIMVRARLFTGSARETCDVKLSGSAGDVEVDVDPVAELRSAGPRMIHEIIARAHRVDIGAEQRHREREVWCAGFLDEFLLAWLPVTPPWDERMSSDGEGPGYEQ